MRGLALTITLALLAAPALAQEAPAAKAVCAAMDQDLPTDLAAWKAQAPLLAAASPAGLSKATLTPGRAILADLPQTSAVKYVVQPDRPAGPASHGGLFELRIARAGTYAIALGSGAWIDVLKDGKALTSTAHSHGPTCSTIHKVVDFHLEPGRYVLQLSSSTDAKPGVLVARRP